jgi:phosphoribosylglycinamide formyltransferase-1
MDIKRTVNIALFCSGSGSNAEKIMEYFHDHDSVKVAILLSNSSKAYALERASKFNVPTSIFDRNTFYTSDNVVAELQKANIDLVVLAGFLWLIPQNLIKAYPGRILNIHPALLPAYGGKGMYGMNVHKAVKEAGEAYSGMTIHIVDEEYDSGKIVFQAKCSIDQEDSAETIAGKVLKLEHAHFAPVIEDYIKKNLL